jgi:hypothetical protein
MRMAARRILFLSFVAGSIFGAAALWMYRDEAKPAGALTPDRVGDRATSTAARQDHSEATKSALRARSEDLERTSLELAREREAVARLREALDRSPTAPREPSPKYRRPSRRGNRGFDADLLASIGFGSDDIEWVRERWERAELDRRDLAALEDRGEEPPPGRGYSDIERELREDLGAGGYDAMLYATHQNNRVLLERVRDDSIAQRAGLGNGSVVWSYDGQRVFRPKELAELSTTGSPDDFFEIVIVTPGGTERLFVEGGALGAELLGTRGRPNP